MKEVKIEEMELRINKINYIDDEVIIIGGSIARICEWE